MPNPNESAFPHTIYQSGLCGIQEPTHVYPGLTRRELACIELCLPETGDPELDAMIWRAARRKVAGMAMQGMLACIVNDTRPYAMIAENALHSADALLAALEDKTDGK